MMKVSVRVLYSDSCLCRLSFGIRVTFVTFCCGSSFLYPGGCVELTQFDRIRVSTKSHGVHWHRNTTEIQEGLGPSPSTRDWAWGLCPRLHSQPTYLFTYLFRDSLAKLLNCPSQVQTCKPLASASWSTGIAHTCTTLSSPWGFYVLLILHQVYPWQVLNCPSILKEPLSPHQYPLTTW